MFHFAGIDRRARSWQGRAAVMALALGGALHLGAGDAHAANLTSLVGDWQGRGTVKLANGGEEPVRCRVSYAQVRGNVVDQSLRCASISYRIDAVSRVQTSGRRLTGTWEEKRFETSGDLSGALRDDGFTMRLVGTAFTAGMNVEVDSCTQVMDINVNGIDIRQISMKLRKRPC